MANPRTKSEANCQPLKKGSLLLKQQRCLYIHRPFVNLQLNTPPKTPHAFTKVFPQNPPPRLPPAEQNDLRRKANPTIKPQQRNTYQVIQAVTFSSPSWRSQSTIERVTFSPSQKSQSAMYEETMLYTRRSFWGGETAWISSDYDWFVIKLPGLIGPWHFQKLTIKFIHKYLQKQLTNPHYEIKIIVWWI